MATGKQHLSEVPWGGSVNELRTPADERVAAFATVSLGSAVVRREGERLQQELRKQKRQNGTLRQSRPRFEWEKATGHGWWRSRSSRECILS